MHRGLKGIQGRGERLGLGLVTSSLKPEAETPSEHESSFIDGIFGCYRRKYESFVLRICDQLSEEGVSVWVDQRRLLAGTRWMDRIEEAISQSRVVLVFIGPSGLGDFQKQEVRLAMKLESQGQLHVIPVILPRVGDKMIPPFLSALEFVDYRSKNRNGGDPFQKLLVAIREYLNR